MSSSRCTLAGALLLGALSACSPAPAGHSPAQTVTLGVEPRSTQVQVGGTARFAATVTGTADASSVSGGNLAGASVTQQVIDPQTDKIETSTVAARSLLTTEGIRSW